MENVIKINCVDENGENRTVNVSVKALEDLGFKREQEAKKVIVPLDNITAIAAYIKAQKEEIKTLNDLAFQITQKKRKQEAEKWKEIQDYFKDKIIPIVTSIPVNGYYDVVLDTEVRLIQLGEWRFDAIIPTRILREACVPLNSNYDESENGNSIQEYIVNNWDSRLKEKTVKAVYEFAKKELEESKNFAQKTIEKFNQ